MKKILLIICTTLGSTFFCSAQSYQLIDLERNFLNRNYALLAQHYNVSQAEALQVQSKLWNNPSVSISEVNLWKTYAIESQGKLFGNYGRNQQIAIELEQLVETAGKRKKRSALFDLQIKSEKLNYEELLKALKLNLRTAYYQLLTVRQQNELLQNQIAAFEKLLVHYQRQATLQHVSKSEVLRIQSELMNLRKEQIALDAQKQGLLKDLRLLTQINDLSAEDIQYADLSLDLSKHVPSGYIELAMQENIQLLLQEHQVQIANQQILIEKAARTPDLALSLNYDRGGNIMKDFVGIGLKMDLPIWNRNKGNIKVAQWQVEQEKLEKKIAESSLQQSLLNQFNMLVQYEKALANYTGISDPVYEEMAQNYSKHLQSKQITLLEFIDFMQSYREARASHLELITNYYTAYQQLQYLVGTEFKI